MIEIPHIHTHFTIYQHKQILETTRQHLKRAQETKNSHPYKVGLTAHTEGRAKATVNLMTKERRGVSMHLSQTMEQAGGSWLSKRLLNEGRAGLEGFRIPREHSWRSP